MHIFIAALCIIFKKLEITQISIDHSCVAQLRYVYSQSKTLCVNGIQHIYGFCLSTATNNNTNKSHKHKVRQRMPDTKKHIVYGPFKKKKKLTTGKTAYQSV